MVLTRSVMLGALALATLQLTSAQAQRLQPRPQRMWAQATAQPLVLYADGRASGLLGSGERDYRYEGLYVGLAAGFAVGAYAAISCANRQCAVRPVPFTLLTVVLGGGVGALIGGAVAK